MCIFCLKQNESYSKLFEFTKKKCKFPDTGKAHVRPQTPHTDVNRTHSRTYRFIYIDSRTDTVLLYTSCTDGLYFCVHYCTTWHYLNIHLWCTHYAWISCTAVQLYCSPVSVRLYCQLVCPRKITLMNRVDQSQLSLDLPASLWLVH